MPPRFKDLLPSDNAVTTMRVKLSETITMKCVRCGYAGFAKVVIGRSEYAIYKCPTCNSVAQGISAKGK